MNKHTHVNGTGDERPDLLTNKYRPSRIEEFRCHPEEALRLKNWIQDFIKDDKHTSYNSDPDYSNSDSEENPIQYIKAKCVLLTGPPGVGKTSLVYTIAEELKLHVIESHPSEKRDFKLLSTLKLANQKGKINPIAKMFQSVRKEQLSSRRKRLKLIEPNLAEPNTNQLSLSGDISILLFDDIDVVFEEDGPFLKSLVEFIRDSKRPVILTATQSTGHIMNVLGHFEHIHLNKPVVKDCALLLKDICRRESFPELGKLSRCQAIANYYDCDIRQCLNRIQFYGNQADDFKSLSSPDSNLIPPDFTRLNLSNLEDNKKLILSCYTSRSIVDLLDNRLNFNSKSISLEHWLEGRPSVRTEEYAFNQDLGEQIRESIIELTKSVHLNELMTEEQSVRQSKTIQTVRERVSYIGQRISGNLITRVEPPEHEFFIDIVPLFGEIVKLEEQRKLSQTDGEHLRRRTRRVPSYLEEKKIYFENEDIRVISQLTRELSESE